MKNFKKLNKLGYNQRWIVMGRLIQSVTDKLPDFKVFLKANL